MSVWDKEPHLSDRIVRWREEQRQPESQPRLIGLRHGLPDNTMHQQFTLDWEDAGIAIDALRSATRSRLESASRQLGSHLAIYDIAHALAYQALTDRMSKAFVVGARKEDATP